MVGCLSLMPRFNKRALAKLPTVESRDESRDTPCLCTYEPLPAYTEAQKARLPFTDFGNEKLSDVMAMVSKTIEKKIRNLDGELRDLSLKMWDLKEIRWEESKTHDLFVKYFSKQPGWKVTPHAHGLKTAFACEFSHSPKSYDSKKALPTVGFQSELDALPGIGHACGHNLIAISGVACSLSVAEALVKHDIPGRIILLGTPAEEGGGGKLFLIKAGAYKPMDACLMVHPSPLDSIGTMIAVVQINVTYTGRTAHAGAAPWQGINAQDAGVLAYNNISALRQQIEPTCRVHGIIQGKDWTMNVIPAYCELIFNVRAPTVTQLKELVIRVNKCFEAAATATGCKMEIKQQPIYKDVANNSSLAKSYQSFIKDNYGRVVDDITFFASTDFGNVTYELPALHVEYSIPLKNQETDGNHTIGFADASKTEEAHQLTLQAALGIATVGAKIIVEKDYRKSTQDEWKKWKDSL